MRTSFSKLCVKIAENEKNIKTSHSQDIQATTSKDIHRHAKISQVGAQKKVSFMVSRQYQLLAATSLDNKSFIVIILYLKAK